MCVTRKHVALTDVARGPGPDTIQEDELHLQDHERIPQVQAAIIRLEAC